MQKSISHEISRIKFYVTDTKWIERMIIQLCICSLWFKRRIMYSIWLDLYWLVRNL